MKRSLFLLLLLLLAACDEEWEWSGVEAGNATLAGVLKNTSGTPVAQTVVSLHREGRSLTLQTDTTDDSGRFQFTDLTAGDYVIRATVAGKPIAQAASIAPGQTYVQLEIIPSQHPSAVRSAPLE